jgi:hypothetical protein
MDIITDTVRFAVFVRVMKSRRIRWGSMWHLWERSANKILVGKPEGKRPLGRHRHRWEDNIVKDLREIEW